MHVGKNNKFYADAYFRHSGVTGSCILNSVHWPSGRNVRFIVDAGAAQGIDNKGFYNLYFPYNTEKISFAILTHGHHDHQGMLPVVIRQGFRGPIFCHYATSTLMNISLYDSCRIEDSYTGEPLCSQNEVEKTLDKLVGCCYKRILKPDKNIRVVFYTNGHLVGAVLTLVVITCPGEEDITLLYTGDYKDNNIFFNVEMPPKQVRDLNISAIFCESTYGHVDSTNPMFEKCLQSNSVQALKDGKTIIYPAFSQGRCQEILFHVRTWKQKGLIPENIPVYLDGKSAQEYTTNYMYTDLGIKKLMQNFVPKELKFIPRTRDRMNYRREIMGNNNPKIIISSGGMASYGPVVNYIDYYLSRDDALIHLLGYCSPDTQGHKLLITPSGEKLTYNGHEYVMKCSVAKTSELSGHAPRDKMLRLIKMFPNTKSIIINHGEKETKVKFREYLLEHLDLSEEMISVAGPEIAYRIESTGIADVFPTNFESIL